MTEFQRWHEKHWPGATAPYPAAVYRIVSNTRVPSVNTRSGVLWRPDRRFPGDWFVRRHECGGLEISFSAIRHGARPPRPVIIPAGGVDKFILSCVEVRGGPWTELHADEVGVPDRADLDERPLRAEDEELRDPQKMKRAMARASPRWGMEAIRYWLGQLDAEQPSVPGMDQMDQNERNRWFVDQVARLVGDQQ